MLEKCFSKQIFFTTNILKPTTCQPIFLKLIWSEIFYRINLIRTIVTNTIKIILFKQVLRKVKSKSFLRKLSIGKMSLEQNSMHLCSH